MNSLSDQWQIPSFLIWKASMLVHVLAAWRSVPNSLHIYVLDSCTQYFSIDVQMETQAQIHAGHVGLWQRRTNNCRFALHTSSSCSTGLHDSSEGGGTQHMKRNTLWPFSCFVHDSLIVSWNIVVLRSSWTHLQLIGEVKDSPMRHRRIL